MVSIHTKIPLEINSGWKCFAQLTCHFKSNLFSWHVRFLSWSFISVFKLYLDIILRVLRKCVCKVVIDVNSLLPCGITLGYNFVTIGSGNGLFFVWHQAITWNNVHLASVRTRELNLSEIWVKILKFPSEKMCLTMLSAKWWPFCSDLNVLCCLHLEHWLW